MAYDRTRMAELFDYDLWANRKWLAYLAAQGMPDPDAGIFRHILAAQEIWAERCLGNAPDRMPEPEAYEATLVRLNETWKSLVKGEDPDRVVAFRRTNGQALAMQFGRIAQHVVNHGTYHRGELRGLCRARGETGFPETDYAGFAFDAGLEIVPEH